MKVIFIKDLKKTAKKGEIKEVKDGYAENFLIKNGYAVVYNDRNVKTINTAKKNEELQDQENRDKALKIKTDMEKETLIFKVKTGEHDKVFGSISTKQIKEMLDKKGYKLDKKQINVLTLLQSLGYHKIEVMIYKDIKAEIKVQLVK